MQMQIHETKHEYTQCATSRTELTISAELNNNSNLNYKETELKFCRYNF